MDDRTLRSLLQRLDDMERQQVKHRLGVVTAVDPLSVALGGSDTAYTGVRAVGGGLVVGDVVSCITFGNDLLVLGKVSETGGARPLETFRQEGQNNGYYPVSFVPQRVRVDAANSIDLAWTYTPPVDVWAEVKGHLGLVLQDGSAAWYYLQLKQNVSPAPSVGDGFGYDTVTGHSAAGYHALDVTRTYALDAGVAYTVNHDLWAQAASVWKYYQGHSYLWMEAKVWAR